MKYPMRPPIPKPEKRQKNTPRPITKFGKRAKSYKKFRDIELLPERNHEGYFICTICGAWVDRIAINHIVKRSVDPTRVKDKTNIDYRCFECDIKGNPDSVNTIF